MPDNKVQVMFRLVRLAAQIMLESGGEIYRVEETTQRICASLGMPEVDVIAIPTGIFISVETPDRQMSTTVKRIRSRITDLSRISQVNQISREITAGSLAPDQAMLRLEDLRCRTLPFWRQALSAALSAGFFALLFGGGWFEFLAALLCGLAIQTVRRYVAGDYQSHVLFSLLGGMTATLVALLLTGLMQADSLGIIITGAIMPLVPGLAMTHAVRDTMRGDLVSGVTGAAEALLTAILIAVGVGLVLALRLAALPDLPPANGIGTDLASLLLTLVYCYLATLFFADLFHAPWRAIPAAATVGSLGYLVWYLINQKAGASFMAFFAATLLMAITSEILARLMKLPATVFITTAIIPIVPGLGLYQTMLLIVGQNDAAALRQGVDTLAAIGTMALALAVNALLTQWIYRGHTAADGRETSDGC